jgi:hypothetical protein
MATVETGVVFHRWSTHGTVTLDLSSNSFSLVKKSGGDYPLALYRVNFVNESGIDEAPPSPGSFSHPKSPNTRAKERY